MWRLNLLLEFDPVWSVLWYTLRFAIDRRIYWQRGKFTGSTPTTNGCVVPSMTAPGQYAKVLLCGMNRVFPDEVQVKV